MPWLVRSCSVVKNPSLGALPNASARKRIANQPAKAENNSLLDDQMTARRRPNPDSANGRNETPAMTRIVASVKGLNRGSDPKEK